MPIVNYERYCEMLEKAMKGHYAYPAINVTSNETINAALEGFAEREGVGVTDTAGDLGQPALCAATHRVRRSFSL